jgi:hypothetical protein
MPAMRLASEFESTQTQYVSRKPAVNRFVRYRDRFYSLNLITGALNGKKMHDFQSLRGRLYENAEG